MRDSGSSSGLGVLEVLGIVFIVLKLVHVIGWPWVWVLSPFWISFVIVILLVLYWHFN